MKQTKRHPPSGKREPGPHLLDGTESKPPDRAALSPALLIGLRETLESGMPPQELANRLGPLIDTIADGLARQSPPPTPLDGWFGAEIED